MNKHWNWGLAVLLAAGAASAQQDETLNPSTSAAKHVAMINADLESAKAQADMLSELSKSDTIWDEAHGREFVKNLQESIGGAEAHIQHLQPLARSSEERRHFEQLQLRTSEAKSQSQAIMGQIGQRQALHDSARRLEHELDRSLDPLEKLADEMRVPIDVD